MERVHYYSDYDMSIPMHIERMADVVRSYEEGNQPDGINDYLEMYHIVQFIEHGKYPQDWDENKIAEIKQYKGKVAAYFSHLQSNDLPVIFGEIERGYESTIWQIIDQFRIKGLIRENGLREILKEKSWLLKDLLEHRWIVEQNQILLAALLKENKHTAEWLLEQYVKEDRFSQHRDLYFPKSLTGTDKDTIVRNYVNSDKANLNYVRLVLVAKRSSEFPLHPLTIKDARRKEQILNKAILELGSIHLTSYGVALTEEMNAPVKESRVDEEGRTMFVYNKNVIDECKDATIVYYCGQVFEFTEEYGFISLISKDAEKNTMEKVVGFHARNMALMAASGFMQRNWLWVLFGIAVLYVIAKAVLELPKIRLEVDRIKLKIPKIGILIQTIYTARFARTLCSLYTSGLPIVTALQVSKDTIGNSYLESQFDETIAMVRRGESLSDALAHIDGFHKKLAGNVAIGEETGSLDTMLISAADNFEYESEQAISRLISFLEPAMIIVMAVIVGMIMIAVMLPLLNMYAEIEASGTM